MSHKVKCYYCGSVFDRDKEPYIQIPNKKRYAHTACYERNRAIEEQQEKDKTALEEYIKGLFGYETLPTPVIRQINTFVTDKEYNYSYSGILKTLIYFYEIKKGSKEKSNGRIGIVPYIYNEANCYYYSIWLAQQENERQLENESIIQEKPIEIHITSPKRECMEIKRPLFTFLDEESEG